VIQLDSAPNEHCQGNLLRRARVERTWLKFPQICIRCGSDCPSRKTQLILPYRAWWRSNPVIKAPVCTKCSLVLGLQSWASAILILGASFLSTFYVSQWALILIVRGSGSLFGAVPPWLLSRSTAEVIVCTVLCVASVIFGHYRDRFLRRDHLKGKITDYRDNWVEIASDDISYLSAIEEKSEVFKDLGLFSKSSL